MAPPPEPNLDPDTTGFADRLLGWYDRHHRILPWRTGPADGVRGERPDPYRVWLSEIMLQQTTVQAVKPFFERFTALWPTVAHLAAAPSEDIMKAWAGLGYYSRARNLKACAEAIVRDHGGQFPDREDGLRELPGIGDYTAAAIAAIAFNRGAIVVDGNVERVMTRHSAISTPLPKAKAEVKAVLAPVVPQGRPGDFAQAMMDLGATLCTPRKPACVLCPLRDDCAVLLQGLEAERFPVKVSRKPKPVRRGAVFVAVNAKGAVLLERRPDNGMLGGMTGLPTTGWGVRQDGATGTEAAPFAAAWRPCRPIRHVFTHFELELEIWRADSVVSATGEGRWWADATTLATEAFPTVMKKALESAMDGAQLKGKRDRS